MPFDHDFERRVGQRKGDHPSIEEFQLALALASREITYPLHHLLESLQAGRDASLQQLQRRAGADRDILIRDLVRLSRAVADILGVALPKGNSSAAAALDLVVESICSSPETDETWTFRPAFAQAAKDHLAR